jgi:hypothetical protein
VSAEAYGIAAASVYAMNSSAALNQSPKANCESTMRIKLNVNCTIGKVTPNPQQRRRVLPWILCAGLAAVYAAFRLQVTIAYTNKGVGPNSVGGSAASSVREIHLDADGSMTQSNRFEQ